MENSWFHFFDVTNRLLALFFSDVAAPRENSGPESETYGTFVKKFQNRKTSVSLPEILRQTTMEEFLEAVERVQASQLLTEDFSGSNINNGEFILIILVFRFKNCSD